MKTHIKQITSKEKSNLTISEIDKLTTAVQTEIAFWKSSLAKLKGDWKVVLFDGKVPNAFVTPLVPKKIFVTQGMLDNLLLTEDELGLILAHEVSHLILNHTHDSTSLENVLNMAYLVILTCIGADFLLLAEFIKPALTSTFMAAHSRQNESS